MMHIDRRVEVCVGLIAALGTPEKLSPSLLDALATSEREPLAFGSASGAILTGAMWIDFDGDDPFCEGFLSGILIDLASQLVCLCAVHPPGLAPSFGLNLAEPFKEQHAARIPGTHLGNRTSGFVGGISVHAPHMLPKLLVAVLPFDGRA